MRLFIGIFPPKEYLDYFRDVMRELNKERRNLRPVPLEQTQLTLRFVGADVSPASKNLVVSELLANAGSYAKPEIKIESLTFGLPRQREPRIVLVNIAPNPELDNLIDTLHQQIRGLRRQDTILWKQRQDSQHHISIARLKQSATKTTGRRVDEIVKGITLPFPEPFVPSEMHIVQSVVTRTGPVYQKLESIAL